MNQPAIPEYLGKDFNNTPPGHRFSLYFPAWQCDWGLARGAKKAALDKVCDAGDSVCTHSLIARATAHAQSLGDACLTLPARSTAPFVTGLGLEHPVENGFAFLNPYGVPYLPGASVKGVLRKAAEELALGIYGNKRGWNILNVWWLFGFEAGSAYLAGTKEQDEGLREESAHLQQAYRSAIEDARIDAGSVSQFMRCAGDKKRNPSAKDCDTFLKDLQNTRSLRESLRNRGALQFWDVIPKLANQRLEVDVLTPHFGEYYSGKTSPHDAGQPKPNFFLTIPPDSSFYFHVSCATGSQPAALANWQDLLQSAFAHAFAWLGFGAKTAVGYGQMEALDEEEYKANATREKSAALQCPWVDEQIDVISKTNNAKPDETLRGKALASKWQVLDDPQQKANALADIKARWQAKGWWEDPPKGTARKAKAIYSENADDQQ